MSEKDIRARHYLVGTSQHHCSCGDWEGVNHDAHLAEVVAEQQHELRARLADALRAHQLSEGRCGACGQHATFESLHQADVLMSLAGVEIRLT
ncbi:hypothetical protein [Mycolicibacterium sp.]|uniref:hypothetical protein n=1 Tax=Mycolicibacterium sp. TaxID=2320850 RepID=UPI0037C50C81